MATAATRACTSGGVCFASSRLSCGAKQINVLIKTTGKEVRLFKKRVDQKEWKRALKKHTKLQDKLTISMTTINDLLGAEENGEERGDEENLGTIEKNRKRKRREEEGEAEAEARAHWYGSARFIER